MESFFFLAKVFALTVTGFYFFLILIYSISWSKIKTFIFSPNDNKTFVSIIVAVRNEEKNIEQCLQLLTSQKYPLHLFEIIIVNDFSEDKTEKIIKVFIEDFIPG